MFDVGVRIALSLPNTYKLFSRLSEGYEKNTLNSEDKRLFIAWYKTLKTIETAGTTNNGLQTHPAPNEISRHYSTTLYQSYMTNSDKGKPLRMYWVYGVPSGQITVVGVAKHPESGKHGDYERSVQLDPVRANSSDTDVSIPKTRAEIRFLLKSWRTAVSNYAQNRDADSFYTSRAMCSVLSKSLGIDNRLGKFRELDSLDDVKYDKELKKIIKKKFRNIPESFLNSVPDFLGGCDA